MNMDFERKLNIPMEVKEMFPIDETSRLLVEKKRDEMRKIISGEDDRMLLIIGPCSADNEDSVIDYISRLRPVQDKVSDKILIVPRLYTNKPRTNGDGYKGLLHQPDPHEKPDMLKGIIATRELHMRAVRETGFACADEMLYPENHKYIDDIIGYVAIGARSVENQQHRLTASGIDAPVGMKNPTSGDLRVVMNAIQCAQNPHTFLYRGWEAHSYGNPYTHAILRGYTGRHDLYVPNYHYEDIINLYDHYEQFELKFPSVIIDTNHCNSGKNPFEQPRIIHEVMQNRTYNDKIRKIVKGFMVESYIEDGSQPVNENVYGKSITDPCLGWKKTEILIRELADLL